MSRKALTIAKYLIKNDFINPTIRSRGGYVAIAFMTALALLFVLLAVTTPHQRPHSTSPLIYELTSRLGLSKEVITDSLSAVLTFITTYLIFLSRSRYLVIKEELYELILSQPVSITDVVLARLVYDSVFPLLTMTPFIIVITLLITAGSLGSFKAFLLIPAIALAMVLTSVAADLGRSLLSVVSGRVIKLCRVVATAYLITGATHSLIIRYVSPILSIPLRPVAASLTYPLARSSTLTDALLALIGSLAMALAFSVITIDLSSYLSTEDFRPLSHLLREGGGRGRSLVPTEVRGAWGAVKAYVLGTSVLSTKHLRSYVALVVTVAVTSLGIRYFLTNVIYLRRVLSVAPFVTTVMIPILVSIITSSIVSWVLANDLLAYWVYRVYAIRMYEVAKALMIKYSVYLTEALLVISVVDAVLTWRINYLLMPLASLPLTTVASFLTLLTTTYIASKRRVVKQAPARGNVLEELALLAVELIVVTALVLAKVGYDLIASVSTLATLTYVLTSVAVASLLYVVLPKILSRAMERYDTLT